MQISICIPHFRIRSALENISSIKFRPIISLHVLLESFYCSNNYYNLYLFSLAKLHNAKLDSSIKIVKTDNKMQK